MTAARPFTRADLAWLLPIAERYGEAEDLRQGAGRGMWGWVVPGATALVFYPDRCGTVCGGLTDRAGLRALVRLAREVNAALHRIPGFTAHSHMAPDTWQAKLYAQMGFQRQGNVLVWRA